MTAKAAAGTARRLVAALVTILAARAAAGSTAGSDQPPLRRKTPLLSRKDFQIRTPGFFDCTGPNFPPVWDEYFALVTSWEESMMANGAYMVHNDLFTLPDDLHDLSEKVAQMSHDLLETWFHLVMQAGGSGFDRVLRRRAPESDLEGVCYYGMAQCLWVRAFILEQQGKIDEAMLELGTAMALIGQDFRADYLDSTRWPVRGLEIYLSLQRKRLTKAPLGARVVNAPGELKVESFRPVTDFYAAAPDAKARPEHMNQVNVAAFGTHAALLSEPVSMLRGSLSDINVVAYWYISSCRRQDPMHHYHCWLNCMLLGDCVFKDYPDDLARRLLQLVDYSAEGVGDPAELGAEASMAGLLDLATQLWDTNVFLRRCNLIICTIPLVCSLLRSATPLPLLGYFAMWSFLNPMVPGIGEFTMMHFAEMGKNTHQNAFAFSNSLLADLGAAQTALRLPVVRPFGLYALRGHARFPNPFAMIDDNAGNLQNNVVIPRSWLAMETSFLFALAAFVDATLPTFPLNFTWVRGAAGRGANWENINMANFMPPATGEGLGALLKKDENIFLDSKRMLLYRAALFLPQAPNMLSFYELHSMHLPMFVPGWDWLFRLYRQQRWAKLGLRFRPPGQDRLMKPPLCDHNLLTEQAGNNTFASWIMLYDRHFEAGLPGVRPFESFPALLDGLLFTDFDKLREKMRQHNEATFAPTLAWYRTAALHLLGNA
eukprot:TRINITY_DN45748_c0_g1_i1.p1 TRINITY_DN45748_c0_g1~~TRINITY_DN45748_c0_g1_i1.p1  ORF type:complete len:714 (+),score=155.81 TRINITY_DN45748_c0_g1_i1:277-2418(+)